ncbi:hypothetical protein H6P81_000670 [Aristolochia fimbriata]|uniref:BHLH domain-containing protein n=1 Tax=Aristolochia fimbriata TaxID=158543 RepID=A0AAV7F843_ARIFI|nr:hypothetical protein H6P81_000670 [Aristolochia fimbriata]
METDHLGSAAFHFPELGQVSLGTKTRAQELLASWLDTGTTEDANYNGSFADQLPDLHNMLDDDFFQFATAEFGGADPLLSTTHDAFLLDDAAGAAQPPMIHHPQDDDAYHPTLPDACFSDPPPNTNATHTSSASAAAEAASTSLLSDSDIFLAEDFYLIAPNDGFEGESTLLGSSSVGGASINAPASSSTTSTTSRKPAPPEAPQVINASPAGALGAVPRAAQDTPASDNIQEEEDEEEEAEINKEEAKPGTAANCKNLVSERNRRKRLSQQLLALRALVPNITKMDKRSVLVDALAYLRSIHEETARIQAELKERARGSTGEPTGDNDRPDPNEPQKTLAPPRIAKPKAQILEIDTEKIEERRFVVKMTCKGESGVGAEVLRVIESLGFEITYTAIEQLKPQHVLTTVFIRVRRQGRMTEDKLKDCITSTALRSGLTLHNP